MSGEATNAALANDFEHFLKKTKDKGEYVYFEHIRQMPGKGLTSITIDGSILPPDLFDELVNHYEECVVWLNAGLHSILSELDPDYAKRVEKSLSVQIVGLEPVPRVDKSLAGKFVCIEGKVNSMTHILQVPTVRRGKCKNCPAEFFIMEYIKGGGKCPACKNKGYDEIVDDTNLEAFRLVELVVLTDRNRGLDTVEDDTVAIWVEIRGELANLDIEYGDTLRACGVVKPLKSKTHLPIDIDVTTYELYQVANSLTFVSEKKTEITLTPADIQAAQKRAEDPLVMNDLIASFAPQIYVDPESLEALYKEAIIYTIVGADIEINGIADPDIRGDTHIIAIGDPSTGKSEDIRFAARVSGGIYASAEGLSRVGISVGLEEDKRTGKRIFRAGLAVLGNGKLKALDEIDKIKDKDDLRDLQTILDKAIYTLFKIRNKVFKTKGPWLATCNPIGDKYNPYKDVSKNVPFDPSLLNRFDLVFILRRSKDKERNRKILKTITDKWKGLVKAPLTPEEMTKYLYVAKTSNTNFTIDDKLLEPLEEYYLNLTAMEQENLLITERQFEGMVRLTIARARTHLRNYLTEEDVARAKLIFETTFAVAGIDPQSGKLSLGNIGGTPQSQAQKFQGSKIKVFLSILGDMQLDIIDHGGSEIEEEAFREELRKCGKFKDDVDINEIMNKAEREGAMYRPRKGFVKAGR